MGDNDIRNDVQSLLILPSEGETETSGLTEAKIKRVDTPDVFRPNEAEKQEQEQSLLSTMSIDKEEPKDSDALNVIGDENNNDNNNNDDDDDDGSSTCLYCQTYRDGPCKSSFRLFERCSKSRGKDNQEECMAEVQQFSQCALEYITYYDLIWNKAAQRISADYFQGRTEAAVPMPNAMAEVWWWKTPQEQHPDYAKTLKVFVQDSLAERVLSDALASKGAREFPVDDHHDSSVEWKEAIAKVERLEAAHAERAIAESADAQPNYHPAVVTFNVVLKDVDEESRHLVESFALDEHGVMVGSGRFPIQQEKKTNDAGHGNGDGGTLEEGNEDDNKPLVMHIAVDPFTSRQVYIYATYVKTGQETGTEEEEAKESSAAQIVYKSDPIVLLEAAVRTGMPMECDE